MLRQLEARMCVLFSIRESIPTDRDICTPGLPKGLSRQSAAP